MGSGSSGYFRSDPETIKQQIDRSKKSTESSAYAAEVSCEIADLLSNINNRDSEAISTHLAEIKKALEREIDGTVDLLFGGSVSKHTYVDGLSDIDSLVVLNNSDLTNKSPREVLEYFASRLGERFRQTEISIGTLAVTLKFNNAEVQLLPAIKNDNKIHIPNASGNNWSKINPQSFSEKLSSVNKDTGMKVVPLIKLAKAAISNLPEKHQISGYHTEALAVKIFRSYDGEKTTKNMLNHFFTKASEHVKSPIVDSTGQSVKVDKYLGVKNSLERRIVSDAFSRVHRRLENADLAQSATEWMKIFN